MSTIYQAKVAGGQKRLEEP